MKSIITEKQKEKISNRNFWFILQVFFGLLSYVIAYEYHGVLVAFILMFSIIFILEIASFLFEKYFI